MLRILGDSRLVIGFFVSGALVGRLRAMGLSVSFGESGVVTRGC